MGIDYTYDYPGDPSIPPGLSECGANNPSGDRRFVITSNDFTLPPGSVQNVVMALVTTNPDTGNGCPSHGFAGIKEVADTAWKVYYNPPPPLPTAINTITRLPAGLINVYPNPVHEKLYIENTGNSNDNETITIYNTIGQRMNIDLVHNGQKSEADISKLPTGLYVLHYNDGAMQQTIRLVKQ
jgi:hypothetical protein